MFAVLSRERVRGIVRERESDGNNNIIGGNQQAKMPNSHIAAKPSAQFMSPIKQNRCSLFALLLIL